MRNSPLVAGAITWSRALLKKIEDPMRIFKENKFITSYRVRNLSWVEFYESAPKRKSLRIMESVLFYHEAFQERYDL